MFVNGAMSVTQEKGYLFIIIIIIIYLFIFFFLGGGGRVGAYKLFFNFLVAKLVRLTTSST